MAAPSDNQRCRRASVAARARSPTWPPLFGVFVVLGALSSPACNGGSREPFAPLLGAHVVLISIDTLSASHLGCYGYDRDTTPNIDAFAAESLRFDNVYAAANNTGPSHMTMMTGMLPDVHGVEHNIPRRPADTIRLLPELLSEAGYHTMALADGGFITSTFGFDRGFDLFESELKQFKHKLPLLRSWLANPPNVPTFLFVHTYETHAPYAPRREHDLWSDPTYDGWFAGPVARIRKALASDKPLRLAGLESRFWPPDRSLIRTPRERQHLIDLYDGDVHQIDAHMGELFELLRGKGWFDDAWIVLISDHGEAFGEHGSYEHRQLYNADLKVPLIIHPPGGLAAGRREATTARILDLAPTVLYLVGLEAPPMQGSSLLPLSTRDRPVYSVAGESKALQSFLAHGHKLIHRDAFRSELYDVVSDPDEENNLCRHDSMPVWDQSIAETMAQLKQGSAVLRAECGEPELEGELPPEQLRQLQELGYIETGSDVGRRTSGSD